MQAALPTTSAPCAAAAPAGVATVAAPGSTRPAVAPAPSPRLWTRTRVAAAVGIGVAAVLASIGGWQEIWYIGMRDEESSHIWLVPFLAAWLVWVRRDRLVACPW